MSDIHNLKELPKALIRFHNTLPAIEEKTSGVHSSKYAPLSYIQGITVPLLGAQGLVCIQTFEVENDNEYLVTHLLHESGESICGKTKLIKGSMREPNQDWGAGVTYRSRYAYLKMLGISAGMPDIVDQIVVNDAIPTSDREKPEDLVPPEEATATDELLTSDFAKAYLLDLEGWAKKNPTKLPDLKKAYKKKFPDFTGAFTGHVQEQRHVQFIEDFTNSLK